MCCTMSTLLASPSITLGNYTQVCEPKRFSNLGLKMTNYPFCDKSLPFDIRAKDLVDSMTLAEKALQLGDQAPGVPRIGLPMYNWWSEALHGVSNVGHATHFDQVVPGATSFPTVILTTASFNESLWKSIGQVVSTEARAMYNLGNSGLTYWSPNINVVRDPRWGRITETPGEDPYVVGTYAVNYVRGLQDIEGYENSSDLNSRPLKVSASCKHYAAYDVDNWGGVDRLHFDAKVTEQDMVETFVRPFEMCVKEGDVSSVMCSYNRVNGIPTCADAKLLNQTIRGEWALHGYIVSDCDSIEVIVNDHKWLGYSKEEAVAQVMKAGLDLDCGSYYPDSAKSAVEEGKLREEDIDRSLRYLYVVLMRLGFFDGSPSFMSLGKNDICSKNNMELAAEAAREGIVLLKNDNNTLPLTSGTHKMLAVVGPHANATTAMIGNYAGIPCRYIAPYIGLSAYANVTVAQGCANVACKNGSLNMGPAVEAAKHADATIILVGLDLSIEAESLDRVDLFLPGLQTQLINQVTDAAIGPVVLVVLTAGGVDISFAHNNPKIKAIIWAGYPGQEGGSAIADVIFGKYNPGGRLPITWYQGNYIQKLPMTSMPFRPVDKLGYPGRTYKFFNGSTVYPFGYGLSYTKFKYKVASSRSSINVILGKYQHCFNISYNENAIMPPQCPSVLVDDTNCVEVEFNFYVEVQNIGERDGNDVVLVYSKAPSGIVGAPAKQVIGFKRVFVGAGRSEKVSFTFNACKSLSIVDNKANVVLPSGEHTEEEEQTRSWRLESGEYLGDISALCFLPLPPEISSFPFLLAGTGSQILLYDVQAGKLLNSFHVFEGIRVHGICCSSFLDVVTTSGDGSSSTKLAFKIVVFGERKVKLFRLHFEMALECQNQLKVCAELSLIQLLPKFNHWVLDVCFLKEDKVTSENNSSSHLVVGLSNNSVCLWDISRSTIVLEVTCPERTLLYSMRLWGDNIKALRVASGTIYNEVIIWKLLFHRHASSSTNSMEDSSMVSSSLCNNTQLHGQQYEAICLSRLAGHEGSIFRIAWSSNGLNLMSVSDDRSARIWKLNPDGKYSDDPTFVPGPDSVSLILFGHNARIWDCFISDTLIVTVGEDCTCRLWGLDGKQLMLIKEHVGRGIWRCAYDPSSSLLITAGFDSAVKVHLLDASLLRGSTEQNGAVKDFKGRTEIFTISIPSFSDQHGPMDSKSEYVRCLHFTREDTLYVATNHGYLHHVELSDPGNVRWTKLVQISEEGPIVCMDLLPAKSADVSINIEDWIAVGDGKGNATVIRVLAGDGTPKVDFSFTWSAGLERQLLGMYWCKSLGCSYVFTADPRGILKLWRINDPSLSSCNDNSGNCNASLVAEFKSCFGTRILCLDALSDEEVLVCGDQRGNLIVFPLSKSTLLATSIASAVEIPPLNYFKGGHGISSVASIVIAKSSFNQVQIRSTGGDGCVCSFKYDRDWKSLEFTGMKQVKELSLIQSVSADKNSDEDLVGGNYAIGFASADFIIWNLVNEIKVAQVPCGGWRRPHSYYLGDVPESHNCFAFVKDHTIHIHRLWLPTRKLFPSILHMQYHGREIHSLCFVSDGSQINTNGNTNLLNHLSCIATGCEDGTVRLTRYTPDSENLFASKLLGEHVGGSAVRSICFVSKIYTATIDQTCMTKACRSDASPDDRDNQFLLISVGAKRVLTSWLLQNRRSGNKEETLVNDPLMKTVDKPNPLSRAFSSMSFQWLSTDMPSKFSSTYKRGENTQDDVGHGEDASNKGSVAPSRSPFTENSELEFKSGLMDKNENDWRYLAVTAFLVKGADCRLTVCFIVVSCSDTTLTLRALLLPYRLWFDVAILVPQTSPVLALQHVVVPVRTSSKHDLHMGNAYIVISGSTDGSITFWDLTESVEGFMQRVSKLQPEKFIDCQKRPRTGRGSQGGRWWRSLGSRSSKTIPKDTVGTINATEAINGHRNDNETCGASSELQSDPLNSEPSSPQIVDAATFPDSLVHADNSLADIYEVPPFHVLNNVHQSGVNCLHVSNSDCQNPDSAFVYCVLSGGDDQALHCLTFTLAMPQTDCVSENNKSSDITNDVTELGYTRKLSLFSENKGYRIRFLSRDITASAHSSAVRGVWTDGTWAFTTGLDQRVRCWHLKEHGKLTEHCHVIISVPEPETLDAIACGRNEYQIAVAGRGMQMVKFSASCEIEG
ncbi:WD40 repeat [Macleaya cordata]|uniref:WD40 repeat n=1 Tax=Macleaya cordata TaxID=56857 RepID=A0A200QSX8_MACCD|nr:WD40 repeat [Macleaya cordata]